MKITKSFTLITTLLLSHATCHGTSILISKHNLSTSGPGTVKSTTESRVCIFCHTPHNTHPGIPYLWNRSEQATPYIPYESSTMVASPGQPTGASRLCLSCHDGTIALGAVLSREEEIPFVGGIRWLTPDRPSYLGIDLSDDHPISFKYLDSLSGSNTQLAAISSLPVEISLDAAGQIQCTACHDPHDDTYGNFLVMTNQHSALCISCHIKEGWEGSSHKTSTAGKSENGVDPWPNTEYNTVTENGCENCHRPHSAGRHQRLLKRVAEEDNCLVCHDGNVAAKSVADELTKVYTHPVGDSNGVHDAAEIFSEYSSPRPHVECEDCHNPHWANDNIESAPTVSGRNNGVTGIDASGTQIDVAQNLYEICFKCHADNNVMSEPAITRQVDEMNTRLEFQNGNPSFHPVLQATGSTYVPSLLLPYTLNSIIYCTDCHGSDNPEGAQGPHGSSNEHLLVENYTTTDNTTETTDAYALCYKCHSRSVLMSPASAFKLHFKHVDQQKTPCSVCHDAHGISATQGNSTNNRALINFDTTVVTPNAEGDLYFIGDSISTNSCALSCHGTDHAPKSYIRN